MPVKPIKMKDSLDRFYTKDSVAKECIDSLLSIVGPDNTFIDPSAGGGAFFRQLPEKKVGIDLAPSIDGIIEGDWLDYDVPSGCVVVGNPPFGTRNSLTKSFIKHATKKARCVAFILPASYRKETTQRVFSADWILLSSKDIPYNSFTFHGDDYHVPCVFQIWLNKNYYNGLTDTRESSKIATTTDDFIFCKKQDADFFVFGASPSKVVEKELVLPKNRGYYIKQSVNDVKDIFTRINWKAKANSSVSGGVAWYSKQEIINIYEEFKHDFSSTL